MLDGTGSQKIWSSLPAGSMGCRTQQRPSGIVVWGYTTENVQRTGDAGMEKAVASTVKDAAADKNDNCRQSWQSRGSLGFDEEEEYPKEGKG